MIDTGLLISLVALVSVPVAWARLVGFDGGQQESSDPVRLTDVAIAPLVAGLAAARLFNLLLDDPEALRSIHEISIVRSGVDFWPGAAVAVVVAAWEAHRVGVRPLDRLASIMPFVLMAYAVFEATCIVREGCFGPRSPIGIRPEGLSSTQFPVGWVAAVVVAATAVWLQRLLGHHTSRHRSAFVIWVGVAVVAVTRAVASFWLPHIGDGPTRAHVWSLVISGAAVFVGALGAALAARETRSADVTT